MSIEAARAYVERVKRDEEFASRVSSASSKEERAIIAKSEGYDFTPEELSKVTSELSDEELEAVSGGSWGCGFTHESEDGHLS